MGATPPIPLVTPNGIRLGDKKKGTPKNALIKILNITYKEEYS